MLTHLRALRSRLVLSAVLSFIPAWSSGETEPEEAVASIRPEAIRAHVRFLADDLLEGRAAGTRGYDLAARYVAANFEAMGLEPAGGRRTYYQPVPLLQSELVSEKSSVTLIQGGSRRVLETDVEVIVARSFQPGRQAVQAPMAFVGFGVSAPELEYDDYAGMDVAGKIAVMLSGAPSSFPKDQRAYYSSARVKSDRAVRGGAVGIVTLLTPGDERRVPWSVIVNESRFPAMSWLDAQGKPSPVHPEIQGAALVSPEAAETVLASAPQPFEAILAAAKRGSPPSFVLTGEMEIVTLSRLERIESANVAALLRGSDPRLQDEYLVYTAHLDHVGVGTPVDGDAIYNGAYDNASGAAVLLEVARAFSQLDPRPRRSILFLAVTAEESGLLGSDYFTEHPTIPLESIVANLNMDMVLMQHPLVDFVAFGGEHSTLGDVAGKIARDMGLKVSPDFMPEEVVFVRSDQFSFVKKGMPALFVFPGLETGAAGVDGARVFGKWMATRYHKPQDDALQDMDFGAGAQYARLQFRLGLAIAEAPDRPRWNRGDFFGEKFGRR